MQGVRRILSVCVLVVTLCTFLSVSVLAINFVDPRTWDLSGTVGAKVELLENNIYRITSTSSSITAYCADLEPGASYNLTYRFRTYGVTSGGTFGIGVIDQNGENMTLFSSFKVYNGTSYVKSTKFKVPDHYVRPRLLIITIKCAEVIFSSQSVLADESTDKGILSSIKEGFSKLWEWLQGIWDSIKAIPDKIGQFVSSLGDRIKGFFDGLWDKIWNGDGSVPPFDNDNKFAQVIEKLNEWTAKIKDFSGSVDTSADSVTGYLRTGTTFLNSAMGVFPTALTAVLGFALVFLVVRKVVGR